MEVGIEYSGDKTIVFSEGGRRRSENGGLGDGDPAGLRGLRHRTRVEK